MRKIILLLSFLLAASSISFAQDRGIARGAELGELYIMGEWYGIYNPIWGYYDTLRLAVYHITEHGKKLTVQYDADYFTENFYEMRPAVILADATPGVLYNRQYSSNNAGSSCTQLYASFDYGKNWVLREENIGYSASYNLYYAANVEGTLYRGGGGFYRSADYGNTWQKIKNSTRWGNDCGLDSCEVFGVGGSPPTISWSIYHTHDWFDTYTVTPIDTLYVCHSPDIYRGGLPGEVYISSEFSDSTYKVSFSADTGHTFRRVFVSKTYNPWEIRPQFMSDREPGTFYVLYYKIVQDEDLRGEHLKVCIEYYCDYGETLVDIYCHDVHKNYKNEMGIEELSITNYELRVYPNPTTGELTIDNGEFTISNIEVFDVYGRKLFVQKSESRKQNEINISHLPSGIYFVKITTEKGSVTKKVIKL